MPRCRKIAASLLCGFAASVLAETSLRGGEDGRSLRLLDYMDPKNVIEKEGKQPFNILALGGSITWGAELKDREEEAFPHVIGSLFNEYMQDGLDVSVDNLAIRATGADYPSMCLQTLLSEANADDPMKSYDLILLDFILNGLEGFTALMHRLRRRYPDAEIVMVELWNLKGSIQQVGTHLTVHDLGMDATLNWEWKDHVSKHKKSVRIQATEAMVERFQGRHISLPFPTTPIEAIVQHWFSRDWHHLSAFGHRVIAQTIFDALTHHADLRPFMPNKHVEPWGPGDQCYNWFLTGKVPLAFEGGRLDSLKALDGTLKSFIEINPLDHSHGAGGWIEFYSRYDVPVMLSLGYMSRQQPVLYPRVHVTVENDVVEAERYTINPNFNRLEDQPTAHITTYSPIGYAAPGRNVIRIQPLDHTEQPFRLVGIYMCAVCVPYRKAVAAEKAQEAEQKEQVEAQ